MSDSMEQFGSPSSSSQNLEAAASEFRSKVEDAASRMNSAAEQFINMSNGLLAAVEEARQASERAQQAQREAEALRDTMARDYGVVSGLVRDLQQRISALAVLGQPMAETSLAEAAEPAPEPEPIHSGYGNPGESSW